MRRCLSPSQELPVPEPARAAGLQSTVRPRQPAEETRRESLRRQTLYGLALVLTNLSVHPRQSPRAPARLAGLGQSPFAAPRRPVLTPPVDRLKHPERRAEQQAGEARQSRGPPQAPLRVREWEPPRRAEEQQPQRVRPLRRRRWPRQERPPRRLFRKEQRLSQSGRRPTDPRCLPGRPPVAGGDRWLGPPVPRDLPRQQ